MGFQEYEHQVMNSITKYAYSMVQRQRIRTHGLKVLNLPQRSARN